MQPQQLYNRLGGLTGRAEIALTYFHLPRILAPRSIVALDRPACLLFELGSDHEVC